MRCGVGLIYWLRFHDLSNKRAIHPIVRDRFYSERSIACSIRSWRFLCKNHTRLSHRKSRKDKQASALMTNETAWEANEYGGRYWKVSKIVARGNAAYEVNAAYAVSKLRPRNTESTEETSIPIVYDSNLCCEQ